MIDEAEAFERIYGIRVGRDVDAANDDDDGDEFKFDYEKKQRTIVATDDDDEQDTPIMVGVVDDLDLLKLGILTI